MSGAVEILFTRAEEQRARRGKRHITVNTIRPDPRVRPSAVPRKVYPFESETSAAARTGEESTNGPDEMDLSDSTLSEKTDEGMLLKVDYDVLLVRPSEFEAVNAVFVHQFSDGNY